VAACIGQAAPSKPARPASPLSLNGKAYPKMCINASNAHFFGIGDWGGVGEPGHTWTNPGKCSDRSPLVSHQVGVSSDARTCTDADHWAQKYVARQMKKVAPISNPDYVLSVGDHFYPGGINYECGTGGNTPPKDPSGQWHAQFDAVYGGSPGLDGKPWMSVLGNHDYGGYAWFQGWDQQIFQTWERDNWVMPGQYWSRKVQYLDFAVDYYFLDSNVVDTYDPHDANHYICQHFPSSTCWNVTQNSCAQKLFEQAWSGGQAMVEKGLKASTSEWKIIVTHFPPPVVLAVPFYKNVITKYGVDLVVTGHAHYQQTGIDKETGVHWIITGGGGGVTTDSAPDYPGGHDEAYGFIDFAINRTNLNWDMYSWGGVDGDMIITQSVGITSKSAQEDRFWDSAYAAPGLPQLPEAMLLV